MYYMNNISSIIYKVKYKIFKFSIRISSYFDSNNKHVLIENEFSCEIIIFSKDRAIQLHALLSTYFEMVQNPVRLNILYTCSSPRHQESYNQIIEIFADKNISFIREISFRKDLINLIKNINSRKIMFMTDDAVIVDSFDMKDVVNINPFAVVLQLHRGLDAKFNMHTGVDEIQPTFYTSNILKNDMLLWDFNPRLFSVTYNYPLSLDGTLFNRMEILSIFEHIDFKAPNSLESMMQVYSPVMLNRKGVCFSKSKYVNIPCNIVNSEIENISTGYFSTEYLLEKWRTGYRIKHEDFYLKNYREVVNAKFEFTLRN
jgi:hypothetical protein